MPTISMIAAMAKNRVIGKDNQMPWHMPADLAHFKKVTMDKPVVMGRKTYESIGRLLPGRQNVIVTRDASYQVDGALMCSSLEDALAKLSSAEDIMIIGGGNIYQQMLPKADKLHLTFIDLETDGDAHFPEWNENEWFEVARETHKADAKNAHDCDFVTLARRVY